MLRTFLRTAVFIILSVGLCYAQPEAMSLSLHQSIDLALKNNITMSSAKARAQQAQGNSIVLNANLLPQIDAVASQQRTWWESLGALGFPDGGTIGPFNTFDARIRIAQRVLDLAALAHAQAGIIKSHASQWEIQLASQEVTLATSLAYIQVLDCKEALASSDEDIHLAQHLLSLSEHQLDSGLASTVDVARNRTELARQNANQEQLRLNYIRSQLELKRLIRIPLAQPIDLTDSLESQEYEYLEVEQAIIQAKQDRMELRIAQANTDYSFEELKASQRERVPKIGVTADWGKMGVTPQTNTVHAAEAAVKISLPIWEGGRINGDIKEKSGIHEEQKMRLDDLGWKIEEDVRLAIETLTSAREQMNAQKNVEDLAQSELTLAEDRFSAGLGDNTQVIHAQTALADARSKYVQALAEYNQAKLNYFGALGVPQKFDLMAKEGN